MRRKLQHWLTLTGVRTPTSGLSDCTMINEAGYAGKSSRSSRVTSHRVTARVQDEPTTPRGASTSNNRDTRNLTERQEPRWSTAFRVTRRVIPEGAGPVNPETVLLIFSFRGSACRWAASGKASGSGIGPQGRPRSGRRSLTPTPRGARCRQRKTAGGTPCGHVVRPCSEPFPV